MSKWHFQKLTTRVCTKCGKEKDIFNFINRRISPDPLDTCITCRNIKSIHAGKCTQCGYFGDRYFVIVNDKPQWLCSHCEMEHADLIGM